MGGIYLLPLTAAFLALRAGPGSVDRAARAARTAGMLVFGASFSA